MRKLCLSVSGQAHPWEYWNTALYVKITKQAKVLRQTPEYTRKIGATVVYIPVPREEEKEREVKTAISTCRQLTDLDTFHGVQGVL
jgi:hypothetical protein